MKKKKLPLWASLVIVLLALFFGLSPDGQPAAPTENMELSTVETTLPLSQNVETPPPDSAEEWAIPDSQEDTLDIHGTYTAKEDVALYIHLYGELPQNFMTKDEARDLGWEGGGLDDFAPGMCIGGDRFGNYEGLLPDAPGRSWTECDIDTLGANSRGAKRIVFSNDGLIYYTDDHYESFTLLYGEE